MCFFSFLFFLFFTITLPYLNLSLNFSTMYLRSPIPRWVSSYAFVLQPLLIFNMIRITMFAELKLFPSRWSHSRVKYELLYSFWFFLEFMPASFVPYGLQAPKIATKGRRAPSLETLFANSNAFNLALFLVHALTMATLGRLREGLFCRYFHCSFRA